MSIFSLADKQYVDNTLRFFHFTNEELVEFFRYCGVNSNDPKYTINGNLNLKTFFQVEQDNILVGKVLIELAGNMRNIELSGRIYKHVGFSVELEKIGHKLLANPAIVSTKPIRTVTINDDRINIEIRPEIYEHIKRYLDVDDYFSAVSEAYKVVREKIKAITGKEKAIDVFNPNAENDKYHEQLFGCVAEKGSPKSDFHRGIGYIHLAVQFLRNEKAHSLAKDLDKNLAIHYLSLASLAYDLISRGEE